MTWPDRVNKNAGLNAGSQSISQLAVTPLDPMENFRAIFSLLIEDQNFLDSISKDFIKADLLDSILKDLIAQNRDHALRILYQELVGADNVKSIREIDRETAKKEIQEYISNHPKCKTSEIIDNLRLDPIFTMEILKELKKADLVLSKRVESDERF